MVINIQIEGIKALQDKLNTQIKNLENMQKFWHSVGEYMKKRTIQECFEKEQSPDGVKWKPLSEARHKERSKKGSYKILSDTGELRRSIRYRAFNNYVIIGSNLKYARIHQFGGKITITHKRWGRYKHTYSKNKREGQMYFHSYPITFNIPARPYLGVTQADKQHITSMFSQYLKRHSFGGG